MEKNDYIRILGQLLQDTYIASDNWEKERLRSAITAAYNWVKNIDRQNELSHKSIIHYRRKHLKRTIYG